MKRPPSLMTFRLRMTLMVVLISFAPTAHAQTFTTFDVPDSRSTQAFAINPAGQITGIYEDISVGLHGFLRQPDGTIITFDVPGAGSGNGLGTFGQAINPAGKIAGNARNNPPIPGPKLLAMRPAATQTNPPNANRSASSWGLMPFNAPNLA